MLDPVAAGQDDWSYLSWMFALVATWSCLDGGDELKRKRRQLKVEARIKQCGCMEGSCH